MNHEEVLAVLPDRREEGYLHKGDSAGNGLEISSYIDCVKRNSDWWALGALIKWSWIDCDER